MKITTTERTVTELDHVRLKSLIHRHRHGGAMPAMMEEIEEVLDEASVVPSTQVAPNVVTMNSQVEVRDAASGQRSTLTLCYPPDAAPAEGRVSALSPVGFSLLGLKVGEIARWTTPTGENRAAEIVSILFQPEASGDYTV